jgi:hypothetical protein
LPVIVRNDGARLDSGSTAALAQPSSIREGFTEVRPRRLGTRSELGGSTQRPCERRADPFHPRRATSIQIMPSPARQGWVDCGQVGNGRVMRTSVESSTGDLLVGGRRIFPIGLSDPPPIDGVTPSGADAWAEIARAGVTFVRNYTVWTAAGAAEQVLSVLQELEVASKHGLSGWVALAGVDNDLSRQSLLTRIVNALKGHPALGAWKGADEPAHGHVPASGCIAVYDHLRSIDPDHPVVIIEAPRGPSPPRRALIRG